MRLNRRAGGGPIPGRAQANPPALNPRAGLYAFGHLASLALCLSAAGHLRSGAVPWFTAFNLVLLALRLAMLMWRLPPDATAEALRRQRLAHRALGLAWSLAGGALCALCLLRGTTQAIVMLPLATCLGVTAGLATRHAGTSSTALSQIGLWLLPVMAVAPQLGPGGWIVSLAVAAHAAGLIFIAAGQHADVMQVHALEQEGRQARAALAEREASLLTIFENAAIGIAEHDAASGRLLRVNNELCRILGQSREALLTGDTLAPLVHAEDRAAYEAAWAAFIHGGGKLSLECRLARPAGAPVHVRLQACARELRLAVILQDVTEQKAAEAALRASEDMLRLSLEIGGIGSYRRDKATNTLQCGTATRQMHGLPPDEAIPIPESLWLSMLLPEDAARIAAGTAAAFEERRNAISFEYRFLHPTLGTRHIETRSRIQYDAAGEPTGSIGVIIDVTDRHQSAARFAHLAHHDSLTGLPNRALFALRLDDALARAHRGERFAVCCLDLDHFKYVNDALGHPVGDLLLQAVTTRLRAELRATDTVARLGGDEFAVIQTDVSHPEDVTRLVQRLIQSISAPYLLDGHHIVIGTSVGIAMSPDDGLDPTLLMRHADTALYAAKEAGRGGCRFFEHEMDARMQARRAMDLDLREAIETDAFELFYQPILGVARRDLRGFEALLRWNHPTRGLVMPDRFINIAEANGLIVPIGEWVVRRACEQAARWPAPVRVAVNLAAVHFTSDTLVEAVADAIDRSGIDPARLDLEITEAAMLTETETTLDKLHKLKALGVGISMDDFGTGYSSLNYLQRFPFDRVKIDSSFITDLGHSRESAAIVGALIALCSSLEMGTTAEGVETESQMAALAGIGCTEAQGYLFSPPIPSGGVPDMMARLTAAARQMMGVSG